MHPGLAGKPRLVLGLVVFLRDPARVPAVEEDPAQQLGQLRGEVRDLSTSTTHNTMCEGRA